MQESSTEGMPFDSSLLQAALDAIGEGITLTDATGRIVYSNPAADRILGRAASDGTPASWAKEYGIFLPGTDEPFPTERYPLVRALAGEETDNVEMLIRNRSIPSGGLISATGRPVRDLEGTIKGAAVVFRDVTALRQAQADLQRVITDLHELQSQKNELAGFLVHDMKGPLTTIFANTEFARDTDLPPEENRQVLGEILEGAASLHRMVIDLVDIQTADDGHLEPDLEPADLRTLMERATTGSSRLGFDLRVYTSGLPEVVADADLLRRVMANLVDNCVKYGPEGGRIWVDGHVAPDGSASLSVRDEGPGVPEDLRDAIFERYTRLERDTGRRLAGSRGLGLRFCKVAIEAHGGRIWVEDNIPRGACFRVELPPRTAGRGEA